MVAVGAQVVGDIALGRRLRNCRALAHHQVGRRGQTGRVGRVLKMAPLDVEHGAVDPQAHKQKEHDGTDRDEDKRTGRIVCDGIVS